MGNREWSGPQSTATAQGPRSEKTRGTRYKAVTHTIHDGYGDFLVPARDNNRGFSLTDSPKFKVPGSKFRVGLMDVISRSQKTGGTRHKAVSIVEQMTYGDFLVPARDKNEGFLRIWGE